MDKAADGENKTEGATKGERERRVEEEQEGEGKGKERENNREKEEGERRKKKKQGRRSAKRKAWLRLTRKLRRKMMWRRNQMCSFIAAVSLHFVASSLALLSQARGGGRR